jgi:hypothetical protein
MAFLSCPAARGNSLIQPDDTSYIDVTARFTETQERDDAIERIAEHFYHELELITKKNPYNIAIITQKSQDTAYNNSGMYILEVEITRSYWNISQAFEIPFLLYVFTNNYNIEAMVKIKRRDEENPRLIKRYDVQADGPQVFQIIDRDPHAGGLMVSYTDQMRLEKHAERKLAEKLSKDLQKTILRYGGF